MTREEILSTAKAIPFNTEMVRAIQDGRKSATRRKVKPQPPQEANGVYERMDNGNFQMKVAPYETIYDYEIKPPYETGDYLYVQETWSEDKHNYLYQAEFSDIDLKKLKNIMRWGSPKCMPQNAARIFLRVTEVRAERLQDIKIKDIVSEGVYEDCRDCLENYGYGNQCCVGEDDECNLYDDAVTHFEDVWNSTVKKSDLAQYGWDANPWVWVIEFERVEAEP